MSQPAITVLRFPDLPQWEARSLEPTFEALRRSVDITQEEVTPRMKRLLRRAGRDEIYWVLARDWRSALRFLAPNGKARVFVSVFDIAQHRKPIATLFLRAFIRRLPANTHLFAYSAINYRFLREIEGLSETQVSLSTLPLPHVLPTPKHGGTEVVVGTLCSFVPESNLHYLLNVAHYVAQKRQDIKFRLLGSGRLQGHLVQAVRELDLTRTVEIVPTTNGEDLRQLDVFLFTPTRNDHFGPLLQAAGAEIPVLASEVPGIENFIVDAADGFVLPMNDTKPMAELVLRLADSSDLRRAFGSKLRQSLSARYSPETVGLECGQRLFGHTFRLDAGVRVA